MEEALYQAYINIFNFIAESDEVKKALGTIIVLILNRLFPSIKGKTPLDWIMLIINKVFDKAKVPDNEVIKTDDGKMKIVNTNSKKYKNAA